MRNFFLIAIIAACIGLAADAGAELYKYVDENGVVRFTDRISQIPEGQKPEVYQTVAEEPGTAANTASSPGEDSSAEATFDPTRYDTDDNYKRLVRTQVSLQNDHRKLAAERQKLISEQKKLQSKDEIAEFRKKVTDLNQRITAFERKRRTYAKEAAAYGSE